MYLNGSIEECIKKYERQIAVLKGEISKMPDGVLHISKSGDYYTWRVSLPDGSRAYLPKKDIELARKLALKKYYIAKVHDLESELEACRRYVRYKNSSVNALKQLYSAASEEYRRLLGPSFKPADERAAEWEKAAYDKYDKYPEQLTIPTLKENEYVRSKIEASFAGTLFTLNIPYRYEQMTKIADHKIAADFTALDIRTFQEIPIEIFGMMDKPEYRQIHDRKMTAYINSGYIPGVNFLTFYDAPSAPLGLRIMEQTLENFFFINPPVRI